MYKDICKVFCFIAQACHPKTCNYFHCCGSGSGLDLDAIGSLDPDTDPGGQKWPRKKSQLIYFIFWSAGCSLLRAEGFSYSLYILNGGPRMSKLQFLIKKNFQLYFCQFLVIKPRIHNTGFWVDQHPGLHACSKFFFENSRRLIVYTIFNWN